MSHSQPEIRCASFCVLLALLAASPVYSVRMFVNIGRSLTLPCRGAPSRDVEWRFQQYGYPDWLDVADLYTGSFSSGNGFQGRVESFYLKDPGNYSLLLSPVVYSDLGIYKCQYRDETEIILSDVKLEIRDPVRVTFSAGLGSDEVLMLDANKGPARYGERCAQRCELLAQNYTLLLRSVTREDAGVYKVTDPETNRTISSVSLEVSGLSAGEVAGIVVGVLVLAGSAFAVWRFFKPANILSQCSFLCSLYRSSLRFQLQSSMRSVS
ncbi:hypothetical protein ANANG_G00309390 [Anguilla anguilla]|uniref:Ig-like domain-containing protein n=1 Tax=Anguilla anguilla TaxID=7936 RepID=A0A9D3RJN6_ANGAN|nr:hypothetical protein ANANG_G00309390 [Anguilla anguilla]